MGGRRRKTARRSKKLRGGMGYGFGGTLGTAGAQWDSSWGGEITKAGQPVYDTADPQRGSSRRRSKRGGVDEDPTEPLANGPVNRDPEPESEDPRNVDGGRRRRKSRKTSKKTKKTKKGGRRHKKTMRGGASYQSVAGVGASFVGTGSRGLQDYVPYASKVAPSGGPTQNPDGAYRA